MVMSLEIPFYPYQPTFGHDEVFSFFFFSWKWLVLCYVTLIKIIREQRVSAPLLIFVFFKLTLGFGLDFEFGLGLEFWFGLGLGLELG